MIRFFTTSIGWLRVIGLLEGISWILLLFIAMPLKYGWGQPEMVRWVGSAHGGLFVAYVLLSLYVGQIYNWLLLQTTLKVFIGSILPFGTFWVDQKVLKPVFEGE